MTRFRQVLEAPTVFTVFITVEKLPRRTYATPGLHQFPFQTFTILYDL